MLRLLALVLLLLGAAPLCAQEAATVRLDDGRVLQGRVVAMDLGELQLDTGGEVLRLPTARIRECRFAAAGAPPPEPPAAPLGETAAPAAEVAAVDEAELPVDLRGRSLWRTRIEAIDATYPWLAPTAPAQWLSMGLTSWFLLSLAVLLSARVAGSDLASFGRASGLAAWYLVTALAQFAWLPVNHFTTAAMLLGNTALALFWLRTGFGLARFPAVLAFAIQLGFTALGYGGLELADAILKSVAPQRL